MSGVTFAFDPAKPPGKRIDAQLVQVGDEYLNMEQTYKICIKSYIYNGCDGFTMFKDAKVLVGKLRVSSTFTHVFNISFCLFNFARWMMIPVPNWVLQFKIILKQ